MPPVLDAPWKAAIRDRIIKTLDARLAKANEAYQQTIARDATGADSATMERLYALQHQHNAQVLRLQAAADEQIQQEIKEEEEARGWPSSTSSSPSRDSQLANGDPTQALVEGRLAMLTLKTSLSPSFGSEFDFLSGAEYERASSSGSSHTSPDLNHHLSASGYAASAAGATVGGYSSYASTDTEATSPALSITSSPDPYSPRSISTSTSLFSAFDSLDPVKPGLSMSNAEYTAYHAAETHKALLREARAQREKQQAQQDEFRRRAEEIVKRKHAKKGRPEAISTSSSMTSSISSLNTSSALSSALSSAMTSPTDDRAPENESLDALVHKPVPALSKDDVESLLTYHEQQWTYMLTLPSVGWVDFPWPLLSFSSPQRVEDLTLEAVAEYIFKPLNMGIYVGGTGSTLATPKKGKPVTAPATPTTATPGKSLALITMPPTPSPMRIAQSSSTGTTSSDPSERERKFRVRQRLIEMKRRWDPVRFDGKYLIRVPGKDERDMVKDGASVVYRLVNDLIKRWEGLGDA